MTTPAINRAYSIITDAMRDAGLLQQGDEPTPEQLAENLRRLRDLLNLWQTQGLKLWMLSDTEVTLVAGQAAYTFMPAGDVSMTKPLRVLQGYYLSNLNSSRRPVTVISWDEYLRLGSVGSQGAITNYFVNKAQSSLQVTFWPTPDSTEAANGKAHVLLQTQVTNPASLVETLQFPDEWRMALRWGLADDIATGQPQVIMDRCTSRAQAYRIALEDWDVEDAPVSFAPDQRAGYSTGAFR